MTPIELARHLIWKCREAGIDLEVPDFHIVGGELTLDGMPADQWVEAMTSEE
jgi:hypothetical protein